MLQSIRDHTQGWIAGIIISLLILSFALWGIHSYFTGGAVNTEVAEVNGVPIQKSALSVTYERMRRQVQAQSANYDLSASTEAALKKNALQSLIMSQVLRQASVREDYDISQQQIDGFLESLPEFQVNGQFSLERFQQVLSTSLLSADEFLDLIKTTLLIDQPRLGIIFTSFALPNEVAHSIALVKQTRDIQFTVLPMDYFAKQTITVSPQAIQTFYEHHGDQFKTPEQVSVDYIVLSIQDVMDKLVPSEDDIKTFYSENNNLFLSAAKQIEPFEKVKDKVKEVYLHQKAEEQFSDYREKLANLTYEHPETLTIAAKEMGLPVKTSGPFTRNSGGKDISANVKVREMAFSHDVLNLKNNSDVLSISPDTVIVLRIQSHKPAALLPMSAVENKIITELKSAEINRQALQSASKIQHSLTQGETPEKVAALYHLTWQPVGLIERHANKIDPIILDTAFAMPHPVNERPLYTIAKLANGYAIIQLRAVKEGVENQETHRVFEEQLQNAQGLLEYELYKQSLMAQAKIVIAHPL